MINEYKGIPKVILQSQSEIDVEMNVENIEIKRTNHTQNETTKCIDI